MFPCTLKRDVLSCCNQKFVILIFSLLQKAIPSMFYTVILPIFTLSCSIAGCYFKDIKIDEDRTALRPPPLKVLFCVHLVSSYSAALCTRRAF